ncbi:MAG: class I SAM-dependent RNA methyltransferase, partial [Thermodesulfobacteriota bacterium]
TAPGDVVRVEITRDMKRYSEAKLVDVVEPSSVRTEPRCSVYNRCGGCQWQHIDYETQLEWKERIFLDSIKRIAGIEPPKLEPSVAAPEHYNYRSRASFHISEKGWGFFAVGTNDVVDFDECHLLVKEVNETFAALKSILKGKLDTLEGLDIGYSPDDGKTTALFFIDTLTDFDWKGALSGVENLKGYEVSVRERGFGKGTLVSSEGDPRLVCDIEGMLIEANLSIFTQVNHAQNLNLVKKVTGYAALDAPGTIVDLFSGVGNFALPLARGGSVVKAVEEDQLASAIAEANAFLNGFYELEFICNSSFKWINEKETKNLASGNLDVLVLDPPRGGDKDTAAGLLELMPKRIVYISCNPPTMARDLSILAALQGEAKDGGAKAGYTIKSAGIIDMFPQTYHTEAVVRLEGNC